MDINDSHCRQTARCPGESGEVPSFPQDSVIPPEPFCVRRGVLLTSISLQYEWRSSAQAGIQSVLLRRTTLRVR